MRKRDRPPFSISDNGAIRSFVYKIGSRVRACGTCLLNTYDVCMCAHVCVCAYVCACMWPVCTGKSIYQRAASAQENVYGL